MSHELRTPLTAIIGASDLLLAGYGSTDEKRTRYLELQREAGHGLLELINDILDFSKIEAGQLDIELMPLSLAGAASGCIEMLHERAHRKGVLLHYHIDGNVPDRVMGDEGRLRQVILNLLSNAVKFTATGSIRLTMSLHGRLPHAELRIAVEDTGIGISPDRIAAIFERFTQADASTTRRFGGSGLGLAISKRLVELMGGRIEVHSRVGEGSTFAFRLPLMPVDAMQPRLIASNAPLTAMASRHILLAEDHPTNAEIVANMLRQAGHRVTVVHDGNQVVDAVTAGPFDVVLMDIHMPEMDGYEATRILRREGFDRPIIALTASALPEEIERCSRAGMDLHVAKPIDWSRLFAAIDDSPRLRKTA